ncbi:MAG TPA: cytochrome c-type biogenesis protein CcmH [Gaiellaceae bacterium]
MKPVAALVAALALAAPAFASERHPTLSELEGQVMCPTCHTTLDESSSAIARRMKGFISARIAAGDTRSEIKRKLVAQFGTAVLAAPPRKGFDLLAWWLPFAGLALAGGLVSIAAWRWARGRGPAAEPAAALEPELERRLDEELARFDP